MIVVTGATGNVGRALVDALVVAGEEVTAVARHLPADLVGSGAGMGRGDQAEQPSSKPVQPNQAPGRVHHRTADLADLASLKSVFDGAEALFLLVAGQDPRGILDVAKAGGVRRVVLLSSQGAGTRPQVYRHPRLFEDAVRQSGLDWTILRPGGFASNAYAWAEQVRGERTVTAPFGDVALPVVDPADIGEAAAGLLSRAAGAGTADSRAAFVGQTYELTGPSLVTPREQARHLAEALGETVRFVEQTRAEARARMLQFMPEPVVDGTLGILGEPLPAEQRVSPDLGRLLGRAPRTFADWAAGNVAAFR